LWKGTPYEFILQWKDQNQTDKVLIPFKDQHSDGTKRTMDENFVQDISNLRSVKQEAAQFKTQTRSKLKYMQHIDLLLSAAIQYDSQFEPKANNRHQRISMQTFNNMSTSLLLLENIVDLISCIYQSKMGSAT